MTNRLTKVQRIALEQAEEIIRASKNQNSKQPRFDVSQANINQIFTSIFTWTKELIFNEPKYLSDSRKRDLWLSQIVLKEPYLLGILQSVVSIDKNRGWALTGGRNQVNRFTNTLHNFQVAPDLYGWRPGMSVTAQNYYQSDLGGIVETGRLTKNGVLAAMYTVDPTKCKLTGKNDTPLYYQNNTKADNKGYWNLYDYFRVTSFPNPNESMNGLGYCAISRCVELAKLLVSVFEHDRERLGSKAPKGILTINGITQQQWLQSLEESTSELKQLEREYYSGVQVLAGDALSPVTISLTSLSSLPEQFDHQQFIDMIIYGYALAFGYDPREFWPVSQGSLGTGNETQEQSRKASSKGGLDYALNFQEKLQEELPDTLHFEFDKRDAVGETAEVAYRQAELNLIDQMYAKGQGEITKDEARKLLVEVQILPAEFSTIVDEVQNTDVDDSTADDMANTALETQQVQRALERFPDEDIIQYTFNDNKVRTIWRHDKKKFVIRVNRTKERASDYSSIRNDYWAVIYDSIEGYLSSGKSIASFRNRMLSAMFDAFQNTIETGYQEVGGELPLDDDTQSWYDSRLAQEHLSIVDLWDKLKDQRKNLDAINEGFARADGYTKTLDSIYGEAKMRGSSNATVEFGGDDGADSCPDCQRLIGKRHKIKWVLDNGMIPAPGNANFECNGYNCYHYWFNAKTGEKFLGQ